METDQSHIKKLSTVVSDGTSIITIEAVVKDLEVVRLKAYLPSGLTKEFKVTNVTLEKKVDKTPFRTKDLSNRISAVIGSNNPKTVKDAITWLFVMAYQKGLTNNT